MSTEASGKSSWVKKVHQSISVLFHMAYALFYLWIKIYILPYYFFYLGEDLARFFEHLESLIDKRHWSVWVWPQYMNELLSGEGRQIDWVSERDALLQHR